MVSNVTLQKSHGMLSLHDNCAPEFLAGLKFDSGMGTFSDYSSVIQRVDTFQKIASSHEGKVVLALRGDEIIVGYVTCAYPEARERWSRLGELMYEMQTIEVSRNCRQLGVARNMIATLLADDFFEDKIAYVTSFSWHWDLDGTDLTIEGYRRMMVKLMKGHGFQEHYTNEPNVAIKKENIFMARIGTRVLERDKKRFQKLRFGVTYH